MAWFKFWFIGVFLFFSSGCMFHGAAQPPALILNKHILVNKIWDVQASQFIDESKLISRMLNNKYLMLGETHDNPRHHQLQARLINRLRQLQRSTSVSFEMISHQQGEFLKLNSYSSSSKLIKLLSHTKSNWKYTRDYQVVFNSVLAAGFEILPANLSRKKLNEVIKQGESKLPNHIGQMLTQYPLSAKQVADLQDEIVRAHCNMIPPESTKPIMLAQRVKDAVMSLSLMQSQSEIKVLIAGTGHIRLDRGVPLYLRKQNNKTRIFSLAFVEVQQGVTNIEAYTKRWGGKRLPFDYVWFTPAVQRQDLCDTIRHRFKQK